MLFPTNLAEFLPLLVSRLILLLIAGPIHEFAHAWSAYKLGDRTSYAYGRLSLNPLDHIDPIGGLMILLGGLGWFKPVPVNPYQLRGAATARQGMAITAIAGPIANLLLAAIMAVFWRLGINSISSDFVGTIFKQFIWLNIILAMFNMIPLPPLDGSKVWMGIVPLEWAAKMATLEKYGMFVLMALIALPWMMPSLDLMGLLIYSPTAWLYQLLVGVW